MRNNKIRIACVIYFLAIAVYFIIALAGRKYYSYVDVDTLEFAKKKYSVQMVMASVFIGVGFCIWCAKLWPIDFNNIKWTAVRYFFLPLVFCGFSYWWNTGILRWINAPAKREMIIRGEVVRKFYDGYDNGGLRRERRTYYVEIEDTATRYVYLFKCKKRAYQSIPGAGGYINKKFVVGSLGIIYRKDP